MRAGAQESGLYRRALAREIEGLSRSEAAKPRLEWVALRRDLVSAGIRSDDPAYRCAAAMVRSLEEHPLSVSRVEGLLLRMVAPGMKGRPSSRGRTARKISILRATRDVPDEGRTRKVPIRSEEEKRWLAEGISLRALGVHVQKAINEGASVQGIIRALRFYQGKPRRGARRTIPNAAGPLVRDLFETYRARGLTWASAEEQMAKALGVSPRTVRKLRTPAG